MIRLLELVAPRRDIDHEWFHYYWMHVHGEMAKGVSVMHRYVQNHRVRVSGLSTPAVPYLGVAEAWFTDPETAWAIREDPVYVNDVRPDEESFVDHSMCRSIWTGIKGEGGVTSRGGLKLIGLVPERSREVEVRHVEQLSSRWNASAWRLSTSVAEMHKRRAAPYAAVVELWFDSVAAATAAWSSSDLLSELEDGSDAPDVGDLRVMAVHATVMRDRS